MARKKDYYFDRREIMSKHCQYNVIFGERSNGKSYQIEELILKNYIETGKQGGIIRRQREDIQGYNARTTFDGLVKNGNGENKVAEYTGGQWTSVTFQMGAWYLSTPDETKPGKMILDTRPLCYAFALSSMEHYKSTSYPDITTVLFDEMLTRFGYLNNEFVLFMNMLSTIIRDRADVTIFMVGNTVNKDCPYFHEMGLTHVDQQQPGSIEVYTYGKSKLKVACEFTGSNNGKRHKKPSDFYFAFNNPSLEMITGSGNIWELQLYPHCPVKFSEYDIRFTYFIVYLDKVLQCEIVQKRDKNKRYDFTFVHQKTTELKNPDSDLIFDNHESALINHSHKINQGKHKAKAVEKILSYFNNDLVFYSDNETGEIMRNYILWCRRDNLYK